MRPLRPPMREVAPERSRLREWISSVSIHVILLVMLFVVLFPLLWMLLAAFKQRGQAINLTVIPPTTATIEAEPVLLTPPGQRVVPVTFEFSSGEAQFGSVSVAGGFNGWDPNASPMRRQGDVWVRTFTNLEPGTYPYKFVIDGDQWTADPANSRTDADGNSVIEIGDAPVSNRELADATRVEGQTIHFDFLAPHLDGVRAGVRNAEGEWMTAPLTLENGRWRGSLPLPQYSLEQPINLQRRFQHEISFGAAWNSTYTLENFRRILSDPDYPFGRFFLNSLVVASGSGLVTVILCLLAGYSFAVKSFPGRDLIFWGLLVTMLIPGLVFVLPQFAVTNALGWRNTYQGMILPHVANVFGLFLMRQYIQTLPKDLFAAARVDGAGEFAVLRNVVIPLAMPILVTLFLLTFMSQWSNFLWQLIINSPDSPLRTLPVGLALFRGQHNLDWELMMAGACFSVLPIAVMFIAAQRFFIAGLTAGAVKG